VNGTVARRLRRIAYDGRGHHPGPVEYFVAPKIPAKRTKSGRDINGGFYITDQRRREYQRLKGLYLKRQITSGKYPIRSEV
jgi:hypothetical protein